MEQNQGWIQHNILGFDVEDIFNCAGLLTGIGGLVATASSLPVTAAALGVAGIGVSTAGLLADEVHLDGDTEVFTSVFEGSENNYFATGTILPGSEPDYLENMVIEFDEGLWSSEEVTLELPDWNTDKSNDYLLPRFTPEAEYNYTPYEIIVELNFNVSDYEGDYTEYDISFGFESSDGTRDMVALSDVEDAAGIEPMGIQTDLESMSNSDVA